MSEADPTMEVLSIRNKFAVVFGSMNAPREAGVVGESDMDTFDSSLKAPLVTDDDEESCTSSKENHADAVKRKMAMVLGAVKAGVPARPDVTMVKHKLVKFGEGTMIEARAAVRLGADAKRNVRDHLEVALYGRAAESDCIETLSAMGFSIQDIEHAILTLGTEDVDDLEAFLASAPMNEELAVKKLLAMGFAHEDVVKAVRRDFAGAQNLDKIVGKLCKLQDKRLLRAERTENARRIASSLQLGDSTSIAEEDVQLAAKLSKCSGDCNSQIATCLRLVESRRQEAL